MSADFDFGCPPDGGICEDVYERSGGTTTLISTGPTGGTGAFLAFFEGASADGTRVFFSTSERLVSADTDSSRDVYERSGSTTTLVSTGTVGGNGAFSARFRGASEDGTRVFFETLERLRLADADSHQDVYERSGGTTTLLSVGPTGGNGAFHAAFLRASADGMRLFFETQEQLVGEDTDSFFDIYEIDRRFGFSTTRILSIGPTGGNGAFDAHFLGASQDGGRVVFETAERLVSADTDSSIDTYRAVGSERTLVSIGPAGGNGPFPAHFAGASQDGLRVFFHTEESLVSGDADGQQDVYEYNPLRGTTTLLSIGPTGGSGAFGTGLAAASQDGDRVFFETAESLVSADTDAFLDVYERLHDSTTLVSRSASSGNGPFPASLAGASQDGTRVVLETNETLVGSVDTDGQQDVYAAREGGYPRPKGATPLRVPLVIAFKQCSDPDRTHGAPLAFSSCNPPVQESDYLTVGTADANGRPAKFIGSVRMDVIVGSPATPEDEADQAITVSATDIRKRYDLEDYTGELKVTATLRITDKYSGLSLAESATVSDLTFSFTVPCAATVDTTIGATCAVNTTADAVLPGVVREGKRTLSEVGQVQVFDGGPDGDVDTGGNTLFARQGLFTP